MLRRAWGAEAAGCRQGGRFVCGNAIGQRPGRSENIHSMFVTCATSQEPMAPLKVERHGALYTRLDMSVTAPVSHAEMWPWAASTLAGLPHHSASAPCRLLLFENEV